VRATDPGFPVEMVGTTFKVTVTEFNDTPTLLAGSVNDLNVVQNSGASSLGLAGLAYSPGGGIDEDGQMLSYTVTAVPPTTFGEVVLFGGTTVVNPGPYTLAEIQGMEFIPAANVFGGPELFSFTLTDDGTTSGVVDFKTLNQSLGITVLEDVPDPIMVEVRVASSSDDAKEQIPDRMKLTSTDLEMANDQGRLQAVGMRFTGVNIPQGATIQNAYIQFQSEDLTSDVATLTIHGESADNAATFTDVDANISSRVTTFASTPWSPEPWLIVGAAGPDQQTPKISTVIQEIVNRAGWSSSNSLVLIVNGMGTRVAESYDGNSNAAPLLHVEYLPMTPLVVASSVVSSVSTSPLAYGQIEPLASEATLSTSETVDPGVDDTVTAESVETIDPAGLRRLPATSLSPILEEDAVLEEDKDDRSFDDLMVDDHTLDVDQYFKWLGSNV